MYRGKRGKCSKYARRRIILLIATLLFIISIYFIFTKVYLPKIAKKDNMNFNNDNINNNVDNNPRIDNNIKQKNIIDDWRLTLVNYEHSLPENYEPKLEDIDEIRRFDKRAIEYLKNMLNDMRKDGITNIWVQSAYRSVDRQEEIFEKKVKNYMNDGMTREEAEKATLQTINKPETSEHNLGLAVDFNYVDYKFENLEGFKWLEKNAENYGFILRYRKDKENITKVDYEPWHWRYVGEEHAKEINKLDMCLEEYIEYLENN